MSHRGPRLAPCGSPDSLTGTAYRARGRRGKNLTLSSFAAIDRRAELSRHQGVALPEGSSGTFEAPSCRGIPLATAALRHAAQRSDGPTRLGRLGGFAQAGGRHNRCRRCEPPDCFGKNPTGRRPTHYRKTEPATRFDVPPAGLSMPWHPNRGLTASAKMFRPLG